MILNSVSYGNIFWNSESVVEPNALPTFTTIALDGKGTLHLVKSDTAQTASKEMKVENGTLTLHLENGEELYLHLKTLESINVKGDAFIRSNEEFDINEFTLNAGGNANVFLAIKGKFANVLVQGKASVLLSGVVDEQHAIVQNEGNYQGASLFTKVATVTVNGNATALVNVGDELTANASGNGVLRYGGDPETLKKNAEDSAKIERIY